MKLAGREGPRESFCIVVFGFMLNTYGYCYENEYIVFLS